MPNCQSLVPNLFLHQNHSQYPRPLTIAKADSWFIKVMRNEVMPIGLSRSQIDDTSTKVQFKNLDRSTTKRFKTTFGATPQFEHLYIDPDFRIVKTRREAKQRPSYTIAIRRNE